MASLATTTSSSIKLHRKKFLPPLENGDRLTREQYMRRYESMPEVKKAERIEGVVYIQGPVSQDYHAGPHADAICWLGSYRVNIPGVGAGDNPTIHLDRDNDPQPDGVLFIRPEYGGHVSLKQGFLHGPPELIFEVAASRASYDIHDRLNVYRRNGVCEYIVWRTFDEDLDWFVLKEDQYVRIDPDEDGIYRSSVFPGLWLNAKAMFERDVKTVLETLYAGLEDPAHAEFISSLNKAHGETN